TGVKKWLIFNACAPSNLFMLAGELLFRTTGSRVLLHAAITPVLFYGGFGLFVFPWSGFNIIPQISHLVMTANIADIVAETARTGDWQTALYGFALSLITAVPLMIK